MSGFNGMDQLIRDLEELPEALKGETAKILEGAANGMAAAVRQQYPFKTGNLVRHVVIVRDDPLRVRVRNTAKHAHLYEYGTVRRQTNSTGANRGTMPARPVFVPAAVRHRKRMLEDLQGMLRRAKVRGMTGTP